MGETEKCLFHLLFYRNSQSFGIIIVRYAFYYTICISLGTSIQKLDILTGEEVSYLNGILK